MTRKKPVPAPIAVLPSARPARPLASASRAVARGLPSVAVLLSACAALACSNAPDLDAHEDHQASHVTGLGKGKVAPPDPDQLPGLGTTPTPEVDGTGSPSPDPPVVMGEMPAVKPVPPPIKHPVAMPGGAAPALPGSVTPYKPYTPPPIAPSTKHPKLGGDVAAVDPSI